MTIDKPKKKPLLISHRGAHREASENSAAGFEIALGYGVDGIETDVQLTRDGIPVLHHNVTASHITGRRKPISSYTCAELKTFDLGKDGTHEHILTLNEALERFAGRTSLFVEIKSRKHDRISGRSGELTDKVMAAIMALDSHIRDNIRVLSFDPEVLLRANRIAPRIKCVLNTNGRGTWSVTGEALMRSRISMDFLSALCLERKDLSPEVVRWGHAREMAILTYCCNTRKQVARARALEVDGIMTDKRGWLVKLFN